MGDGQSRRVASARALVAACLVASLPLAAPTPAFADDASQARFHYGLASAHYEAGEYREAIREFFLVQEFAPNPHILYNIALAFEALTGRCHRRAASCDRDREQAYHWFSAYLASHDADPERRAHATGALERMRPRVALVRVESEPPGADVYVDRRELGSFGRTPTVLVLPPGEHELTFSRAEHHDTERSVVARVGAQDELHVELRPRRGRLVVSSPVAGRLRVFSEDGDLVRIGTASLDGEFLPGTYRLELTSPQTQPWQDVVRVRLDEVTRVTPEPTPLPPPTADLTVTANAAGAVVEVDGEAMGFVPAVLTGLSLGRHEVVLRHPGLMPARAALSLDADERGWLTATLERPPVTRRSPVAYGLGAFGAAALVSGVITGVAAHRLHDDYERLLGQIDAGERAPMDLGPTRDRGQRLAFSTDALLATGLVSLGVAVILYFTTERTDARSSTTSFSRSAR